MSSIDLSAIKTAARGRWMEILSSLGGVSVDFLDGRNHPCPQPGCGGKDRFRVFDDFDETGGVFCNQCHNKNNGDGIAALEWLTRKPFREVAAMLQDHLGLTKGHTNGNGHCNGHSTRNGKAKDGGRKAKRSDACPADAVAWSIGTLGNYFLDAALSRWCEAKRGVTDEAAKAFHARFGKFPKSNPLYRCIAFPGRNPSEPGRIYAVTLFRDDGQLFPEFDKLGARKSHNVAGSSECWLWPGSADSLRNAEAIFCFEGMPDALAAWLFVTQLGGVPITNACGAGSRGSALLDFSFAAGKPVYLNGDADQPGEDGVQQTAVRFFRAGASRVVIFRLPYPVVEDHGPDFRDWFNEGHTLADFRAMIEAGQVVTEADVLQWQGEQGKPKAADRKPVDITNAILEGEGDDAKWAPLEMAAVLANIQEKTGDWPRRVGGKLFVHDPAGISWLDAPASLFGWLAGRCGLIQWKRGESFVTKEETFAEMLRTANRYESIETIPHEPRIDSLYYACEFPEPGAGESLDKLIAYFSLEGDVDRQLLKAAFATAAWGGPPGCRPAFMFTCSTGRGKGKSTLAQILADTFGGAYSIETREEMAKIKTRLLTPGPTTRRFCLCDNVKSTRFSWGELEALITSKTISGHMMYAGDACRPNYLIWLLTLNGASLSTDMAQRVVEIRLRDPAYSGRWEEEVRGFIDANRPAIFADLIRLLRSPAKPMRRYSRWSNWEASVLSRLDDPDACLDIILERRGQVDVEEEEGEIIEDFFAEKLRSLGYDTERDDVFIPNEIAAQWYNRATGEGLKVTGVTRQLKQFKNEGRLHRVFPARAGTSGDRGFRFVGEHTDATSEICMDLKKRLAEKNRCGKTEGQNGNSATEYDFV